MQGKCCIFVKVIMKKLFSKYKGVIVFLLLFLGSYLVLTVAYVMYLNLSENGSYPPDFVTNLVSKQASAVVESFGYKAQLVPHPSQPSMRIYVEGMLRGRIVEGCNALSIIILFVSFVIAFAQCFKKTLLFLLAGITIIYAANVVRIAILAVALYEFPEQRHVLHGVVFPGIIYGMVFLLWLIWVRLLTPKVKAK